MSRPEFKSGFADEINKYIDLSVKAVWPVV